MGNGENKGDTMDTVKIGDGISYCIGGDSHPYTVRRRTETTIWATRDDFRGASNNTFEEAEKSGTFFLNDTAPREKFTRRKNGRWQPAGSTCGFVIPGRSFRSDPHF